MTTVAPNSRRQTMFIIGAVALVGAALLVLMGAGDSSADTLRGATVKRGTVDITVVERGHLSAKNATSVKSEIEGRTTILSLVEEGSFVQEGDIICELDTSALRDRRVAQEIGVQNAEAAYTRARENLEIQKLMNESEIGRAEVQVRLTAIDLEKYMNGDEPQQLQKADEDIVLAETELKQAEEQRDWSRELESRGFLTRTELEGDELSFKRAEIFLEQAKRAKTLLGTYELPKQRVVFESNLAEAKRELARTRKEAAAELVEYEIDLRTNEAKLALEKQQYDKLVDQIAKGILRAPTSGMVVYGREEGSRWGRGEPIQVGEEVRQREELVSIPATGGMMAEVSLHESVLNQVSAGLPCRITVDAIPGTTFPGLVLFVAMLPDQNAWYANPNLRLFKTEVQINEPAGARPDLMMELRPGMSCSIEIFADRVADTLYVPLQAISHRAGLNICFVLSSGDVEERLVEVGPHNTQVIVVTSGLEEGEVVLMSPPPGALETDAEDDAGGPGKRWPEGGNQRPSPASGG